MSFSNAQANLKPLVPAIARTLARAKRGDEAATLKLGFATVLEVNGTEPRFGPDAYQVSITHHETVILWALFASPGAIVELRLDNGGFRSQTTYGRLNTFLSELTGRAVTLSRTAAPDKPHDTLYVNGVPHPFYSVATVHFDGAGPFKVESDPADGTAYPDADALAALDWIRRGIGKGDRDLACLAIDAAQESGRINYHAGTYAYSAVNRGDFEYAQRIFSSLRRFGFAAHLGNEANREALAGLVKAWRDEGEPRPRRRKIAQADAQAAA